MNFANVKALTIPQGSVYQIISGSTVLWTKPGETPPGPTVVPLEITKTYALDYTITTGTELGVADMMYTAQWSHFSAYGWSRMIGYWGDSSHKWFLGCYKGGLLNPGTQFGSSGDRTLGISYENYNSKLYSKRLLWKYGNGLLYVYNTEGDWVEGTEIGHATGSKYSWTNIIGQNISVSNDLGSSDWTMSYTFYGLRIYDNETDLNLVAEYIATVQNGVPGILNTMTQCFVS